MSVGIGHIESLKKRSSKNVIVSVILISVVVHVVAGLGAALFIVAKYFTPPEAVFECKQITRLNPKIIDPKMAMAELTALAPPPAFDQKIAGLRETEFSLPELPQVPTESVKERNFSNLDDLGATLNFGEGDLAGEMQGVGKGAVLNFFGIETRVNRVVVLFDVSRSVVNKAERSGVPFSKIKEETLNMIDGFSNNTSFGLIQFVRNYKLFQEGVCLASVEHKKQAKEWVQNQFITSGAMPAGGKGVIKKTPNGIESVLNTAYAMQPDVMFLLSDGSFWRDPGNEKVPYKDIEKLIKKRQKELERKIPIHFIGFEMRKNEKKELKKIVRKTGGSLKEIVK